MSLNIQEILESLEEDRTPEEALAAGLSETEKTASVNDQYEQEKIAEELDAQGRIIARSFMDELNKHAVLDAPMTINTGAIPNNPAVEVPRGEVDEEQVAKAVAVLNNMTAATNAGAGEVAGSGTTYSVEPQGPVDVHPIAVDQASAQQAVAVGGQAAPGMMNSERAKISSAEVLGTLYNRFFPEG